MILIERALRRQDELIYVDPSENPSKSEMDIFLESSSDTYIVRDALYTRIATVLNNEHMDRKFKQLVGDFIDKNNTKLRTPGPQYMIAFGDRDKKGFYDVLGFTEEEIIDVVVKVTSNLNSSNFHYLRKNPILWILYYCIRYYTLKKDSKGLNTALAIYALAVYPALFDGYFQYEVSDPGCMAYTMDNLTQKFIFKQQGHLFGALTFSIQQSYKFLKTGVVDGSDMEAIRFIQRIRNDQNSLLKKIAKQYYANKAKGLTIGTALDTGETGEIIDSYVNDTSQVETVVRTISLPIITNGINLTYVEACAKMAQISVSEVRFYLSKIVTNDQSNEIEKFIESILFLWLYDEKRTKKEINTSEFLIWSSQLFRKTNSNNANIARIKDTLNTWGDISGLHKKFAREASRVNYKKALFFYFILCIQYYNN
jgi:hypothetical protein